MFTTVMQKILQVTIDLSPVTRFGDEQNTFSKCVFDRISELADELTKIAGLLTEHETVSGKEILNAIQ